MNITYATKTVSHVEVFCQEAGDSDAPAILLLHGFSTTGHMFRDLIPRLAPSEVQLAGVLGSSLLCVGAGAASAAPVTNSVRAARPATNGP